MPIFKKPSPDADQPSPKAQQTQGFLQRWSNRKANAASPDAPFKADADKAAVNVETASPAPQTETDAKNAPVADAETPPQVTEADLDNLNYQSDYTKFMGEHVPESIRRRALQQLWRSDPILANVDGLCDYDDDFTDSALAVKVLQTAHRIGQGYLTDEEVAENRARGEPRLEPHSEPASEQNPLDEDDASGNDIETASASDATSQDPAPIEPSDATDVAEAADSHSAHSSTDKSATDQGPPQSDHTA